MTQMRRKRFLTVGGLCLAILILSMSTDAFIRSVPAVSLSYRLKSLGYSDPEIADIVSGRKTRRRIDRELKLRMAGYSPAEVARRIDGETLDPDVSTTRPIPYFQLIQDASERTGLDPHLVSAVIKAESNFDPKAISPSGAVGLMQLMPETALEMGVRNPFDPRENIQGGTRYLSYCLDKFGDTELALAAYNVGPGLVERLNQVPDSVRTRKYIHRVMRFAAIYKADARKPVQHSTILIAPLVTIEDGEGIASVTDLLERAGSVG